MRNTEAVVLAAVGQSADAFGYASRRLRDTAVVALVAARASPRALRFASRRLVRDDAFLDRLRRTAATDILARRLPLYIARSAASFLAEYDPSVAGRYRTSPAVARRPSVRPFGEQPAPCPVGPPVVVYVRDAAAGDAVGARFDARATTKVDAIFRAYAARRGLASAGALGRRFLYDGRRLRGEETPAGLDMDSGDAIDFVPDYGEWPAPRAL